MFTESHFQETCLYRHPEVGCLCILLQKGICASVTSSIKVRQCDVTKMHVVSYRRRRWSNLLLLYSFILRYWMAADWPRLNMSNSLFERLLVLILIFNVSICIPVGLYRFRLLRSFSSSCNRSISAMSLGGCRNSWNSPSFPSTNVRIDSGTSA